MGAARDEAFIKVAPALRPVAEAARALVLSVAPDLCEEVKWGNLCFAGRRAAFLGIVPYNRHINLQFWQGVAVDPQGSLLRGTGKSLRHARLEAPEDCDHPGLRALVARAVQLDGAGAR